jgi:hypothetical protein
LSTEDEKMAIEKEKLFLGRWENENVLIGQRLTWLLTSQTLLFAGYGIMVTKAMDACRQKELFLSSAASLVVVAGRALSGAILIGIVAALAAQIALHRQCVPKRKYLGVHPVTTALGWFTCVSIPAIFLAAWFLIPLPEVAPSERNCESITPDPGPTVVQKPDASRGRP